MKVAFIGATGRVGHQVVPFLARDFELTLYGLQAGSAELNGQTQPIHALDITDFAACMEAIAGVDAVVNCAINDPSGFNRKSPDEYLDYNEGCIEVNARGAYHLYEAAARCGVRDFVFISSLTTLLGLPERKHLDENSAVQPVNVYACTKLFGDQVGQMYASRGELRVKSLRLGQPYRSDSRYDDQWPYGTSRARGVNVAAEDIARSIKAALTSPQVNYGVYPIVSRSDNGWIDPDSAREIGYEPIYNFQPLRLLRAGIEIESWPEMQPPEASQ